MTAPDWRVRMCTLAPQRSALWRAPLTCSPGRDVEDYAWRPTFLPRMREQRLEPASLQKTSTRFFAAYAERVAVLDQPKRALRVLRNHERMAMMQRAAESVCKGASPAWPSDTKGFSRDACHVHAYDSLGSGATVAVFETGTGVLPLVCAAAGALSVTGAFVSRACCHSLHADSIEWWRALQHSSAATC